MFDYKNKIWKSALLLCLVGLTLLSVYVLKPHVDPNGDGPSYLEAIEVMQTRQIPQNFNPNRILTTFLGLQTVSLLSHITGNVVSAWFVMNLALYFLMAIAFYNLTTGLFGSERTAFLGTLLLVANYAAINFGLGFFMDIGGWAFYIFSIYFLFLYTESKNWKHLLVSALMVGLGGLFKEYAFLACIPIFCYLVYDNYPSLWKIIKKGLAPATIALLPTAILHLYIYQKFHYTYLDWLSMNQNYYIYESRIIEYIKSFGSLLNILFFPFIFGLYFLLRRGSEILPERKYLIFVWSAVLSVLPIFFWPAITQRILFITLPAIALVSCFAFKKYEKYWYLFLVFLVCYVIINFIMDSFLLSHINLPF